MILVKTKQKWSLYEHHSVCHLVFNPNKEPKSFRNRSEALDFFLTKTSYSLKKQQ